MDTLNSYPAPYRDAIRAVATGLHTNYRNAYFAILFESVMTDLNPSDPKIVDCVFADNGAVPCGSG